MSGSDCAHKLVKGAAIKKVAGVKVDVFTGGSLFVWITCARMDGMNLKPTPEKRRNGPSANKSARAGNEDS
jgi:hypothetical protein